MLRLHGFSSSNYYNIVKLTLLEKELPFEEVLVYTGAGERYRPDYLRMSPLGKVPCLETKEGFVAESRAICEYLEDTHPERPLYPKDPFARAKTRELLQMMDLYLDLPIRRLTRNFFGRKKPPPKIADEVRAAVERGAQALGKLVSMKSYLMGATLTAADISAASHFPFARLIAMDTLELDPLAHLPGVDDYLARLAERPSVKRVEADREADLPGFVEHLGKLYGG